MQTKHPIPLAYFITFRTYATWLHGDSRSSVDSNNNVYLKPKIKPLPDLEKKMRAICNEDKYLMNAEQRATVLKSIVSTCQFADWRLYAAHVRTNHVHIIVKAPKDPKKIAVSFKAYATRYLKQQFPELHREKFWSSGAATEHLFDSNNLFRTMQYVIEDQGRKMALYCDPIYGDALENL